MPERYWLTFTTRHRHGPPTQELVYYQREGPERWRLYYGKAGRRRSVGTDSTRMVEHQVDLARSEGRFIRHEPDQAEQGRMFNPYRGRSAGPGLTASTAELERRARALGRLYNAERDGSTRRGYLAEFLAIAAELRRRGRELVQTRMFNPLVRGYSRGAISENISREMHAGRAQDQAVAIALDVGRRAYRARHPRGRLPRQLRRNPPMRNPVSMMQTGAGYYVSGACGTGGMGFPRGKDGKRAAQLYLYEQRRIEDEGGCRNPSGPRVVYNRLLGGWYIVVGRHHTPISGRFDSKAAALAWLRRRNPTDIEPMPDKPGRYLLRDRQTGRIVASGKDQRTAITYATERDIAERRRRPTRRRNPMGHGEWIDVVVPLVALFVLIRGGVLRVGRNTASAAAPRP